MQSTVSDVGGGVDEARVTDDRGFRDSNECLLCQIPDHYVVVAMLDFGCQVLVIKHDRVVDSYEEVVFWVILDGAVKVGAVLVRAHLPVGCVDFGMLGDEDVLERFGIGGVVI